jgi:hypothetical protein
MNASNDNTTLSRTGMRRVISPWAFDHLRLSANIRFAVTAFLVTLTALLFAFGHDGWAMLPLAGAVVNFAWGYWELTIARSAAPRTIAHPAAPRA